MSHGIECTFSSMFPVDEQNANLLSWVTSQQEETRVKPIRIPKSVLYVI